MPERGQTLAALLNAVSGHLEAHDLDENTRNAVDVVAGCIIFRKIWGA